MRYAKEEGRQPRTSEYPQSGDQEQSNQPGSAIYKTFQKACMDRVRPVIMAPGRWRQDHQEFKVSLSYE